MPPKVLFLDTSGWLALLNESDFLHSTADETWKELGRSGYSFLLTDLIVAETGNGLARTNARRSLRPAVERIRDSSHARIIPASRELLDRALDLYNQRPDKTWGLVDCASFVVMRDHDVVEAFTNDRHFKQAGFRCLLPLP